MKSDLKYKKKMFTVQGGRKLLDFVMVGPWKVYVQKRKTIYSKLILDMYQFYGLRYLFSFHRNSLYLPKTILVRVVATPASFLASQV